MTIREALKAMHYRESRPGCWTKPFGFHLFTYNEEREAWENWYLPGNSETPAVFDRKFFEADRDNFVQQIKHWEAYARTDIFVSSRASFEGLGVDL